MMKTESKRIPIVLFALGIILLAPVFVYSTQNTLSGKSFTFKFHVSEIGNLTHQMDCLSGLYSDDDGGYRKLWSSKLGWSKDDSTQLMIWRDLRQKYQGEFGNEQKEKTRLRYPIPDEIGNKVLIQNRLLFASLLSVSVQEYRKYLELLVLPVDVATILKTVAHFYPRFHSWWQSEAERILSERAEQYLAIFKEKSLLEFSEQVAVFYKAEMPANYVIYFHLLLKPESDSAHSQQIENHALMEFTEKQETKDQLPLVIHEFCHHLYRLATRNQQEKLVRAFIEASPAYSLAAYNLMDEALATAIGNGLVMKMVTKEPDEFQKYLAQEESFYNDRFIDLAAKALMPVVERKIAVAESIYSEGFVSEYLHFVSDALGDEINSPVLSLRTLAGIFNPSQRTAFRKLISTISAGSAFGFNSIKSSEGWDFLESFSELNAVVFVLKSELAELKHREAILGKMNRRQIEKLALSNKGFVYAIRRSSKSHIYVFVGQNEASLEDLVALFVINKTKFDGIGVRLIK